MMNIDLDGRKVSETRNPECIHTMEGLLFYYLVPVTEMFLLL